jgi:hypothetical protein
MVNETKELSFFKLENQAGRFLRRVGLLSFHFLSELLGSDPAIFVLFRLLRRNTNQS